MIENFVFSELLKESTYAKNRIEMHHFRDLRKKEVDIILENQNKNIIAIEVKAKTTIKKSDLKGLIELAGKFQDRLLRGIIFYGGRDIMPISVDNKLFYLYPLSLLA